MATSGLVTSAPAFDDLVQDAVGMVGGGPILAEELASAMRGIDQLLVHLQNSGILLHKVETTTITIGASTTQVTLSEDFLDVLTIMLKTDEYETELDRLGLKEWATLPNKEQEGRPTQYWFDRRRTSGLLNLWPLPDLDATYELVITGQKNAEAVGRAYNHLDVPKRFWPTLVYGIAYWIGLRRPRVTPDRLALIKAEYIEKLEAAMQEDRERGSFFIRLGR